MKKPTRILTLTALAVASMMAFAGCSSAASADTAGDPTGGTPATELRLGYFANITHAPALIGLQEGIFQKALGDTALTTQTFTAGPAAIEALSAGAIDATFIGPNPSINTFIQSGGVSARIVAGATIGGAALVVRDGISSPSDLKGTTIATPQLGNTQDVALRSWLKEKGLATDTTGGGDVHITPTENAQALTLFRDGQIDGAWVPEPWASRLVLDAGGTVLVDEAELWPGGVFPTTVLLVRTDYLQAHPQTVAALVQGDLDAIAWIVEHPDTAGAQINARLAADTGKGLSDAVLTRALAQVSFSADPHAETFQTLVDHGRQAGTQKSGSIVGLFDLRPLNGLLQQRGAPSVSAAGLGEQ
ncbi:ABC transporter substrate-binding protein [Microbacterium laevaniformans]|uniref:ABC transporter substrate-binding protein n=1 Tax=Microbacterium laevaniformans TaxID=36807 RepID=UPI0019564033|nr:ABC transporter substrate-binding protein [Microbacterium laevaniformans]MBM7753776.1 NitT/TauT family transport system substrate-binding protein [Microbacterium laevaniformans]GLJ64331.1 sulfonate ABC transporter substrate-binding protein [Microbacterium laevaniformans]